jgi:hypothetical protein
MQPRHTLAKARVTTVRPSEREIKGEGKRKYREGGMKKKSLRIKMSFIIILSSHGLEINILIDPMSFQQICDKPKYPSTN